MSEPAATLVVIEDDPQIRRFLRTGLSAQPFRIFEAETGRDGLVEAATRKPDLVILDLGLPDIDGVEVVTRLREWYTRPIVILSARSDEQEKIKALDAGADDYLTKPFRLSELLARLRAHLRRRSAGDAHEVRVGTLAMNLLARTVTISERNVHLRPKEFDLLAALASHEGSVVTRDDLMAQVWDERWVGQTKTLDVHVAALRRKLRSARGDGRIVTVRGRGYSYVAGP